MKKYLVICALAAVFSCKDNSADYDASGTFEADETMVVAEATGKILELNLQEGQTLKTGQQVGLIDGKATELQKEQVIASINAIEQRTNSAAPQVQVLQSQYAAQQANISVLQEQLQNAVRERNRTANLVKSDAATKKQLDDANGQVDVVRKQIQAAQTQLSTLSQQVSAAKENVSIQNRAVLSEKKPTQKRVEQFDDQLKHNLITSPIDGTVLTKYANTGEFATSGKPIFKIANLNEMTLRVYFSGGQLPNVKLNQAVKVLVDAGDGKTIEMPGTITWISQNAEFTPKTIQTKDERANLVYAAKVKVKNNGSLKIGMYGEVKL